jgi:monoamine oxidase
METVRCAHWLNQNPERRDFFFEAQEASRVSRRDFIRMLGATGIVVATGVFNPGLTRVAARFVPRGADTDPVAIIGAGVAGLTAAYRLLQSGVSCEIFEASERIGGRIFTRYNFNSDGMFCELGGELVDSDHEDLRKLAHELEVEIQELKRQDKGVDLYFFGGKHYSDKELIPLFQPFAKKLSEDSDNITDSENNYTTKGIKFDNMSLGAYLAESSNDAEKWIIDLLRVAYTIENGREPDEQSSLNLINYLKADTNSFHIFGDSDESKRIRGGSSSITNALFERLNGKVKIHRGHRLAKIGQTGYKIALDFSTDGGTKSVKFSRVICSVPFTMLRLVDGVKALALSREKQTAIAELGYGNNAKVMCGFTERWWRNPAVHLPVSSDGSVYTDLPFQCTWETSRGQAGRHGILTNFLGGNAANQLSSERFAKFQQELNRVFPGISDKFDGKRAVMDWPKYQFTRGSYACPLVGQYTTVLGAVAEPELDGRLIFAGEHTSDEFLGFMNGSVQSGNRAAKEILQPMKRKLRKAA